MAVAKKKPVRKAPPKKAVAKPRAKPPGAGGKFTQRIHPVERVRLAQRIAVARTKQPPVTWSVIAKREGIPQRTCEYIYARFRDEVNTLNDPSGLPILEETLLLYGQAVERMSFEVTNADTAASRIGAARTMLEAAKGRIELLAVLGKLPRSLRAADERGRVQRMIRRMAEVLERRGADPETIRDLLAVIEDSDESVVESTAHELPVVT